MASECIVSPEFVDLREVTVLMLIKNGNLYVSEIDLFAAVKRWAVEECERNQMDSTIGTNLRQVREFIN